jgi:hypothetical protein
MTKSKKRECLERCCSIAENCAQKEDGTWDCSVSAPDCIERCRRLGR